MLAQLARPADTNARQETRTSLFVMATLHSGPDSLPVKVRDLSSQGALIEGGIVPTPSSSVRLCRGSLSVAGEVIWRRDGRAGIRFAAKIFVADWLPKKGAVGHQHRIDEMVQEVKSLEAIKPVFLGTETPSQLLKPATVSAAELMGLERDLDSLAEDLASDPDVLLRHITKLQVLDAVAQVLRKLATER